MGYYLGSYSSNISKVIWNFYEATSITTNSRRFAGAMLAPYADVNAGSGNLEGAVVVKNLVSAGEIHSPLFNTNNATVLTSACVNATPTAGPTATATLSPTPTPTVITGPCYVTYNKSNDTGSSFQMDLTIQNKGSAAWSSWVLDFTFSGNQQVTSVTNGTAAQAGYAVQISHVGWNATVAAGGTVSLSYQASYSGANSIPTNYKVNDVACSGSGGGAATGTATPTPTNTATPTRTPTITPRFTNSRWQIMRIARPGV